jgi:exopolysaccharide biosynthesis WecB/TagA/CpsF family protein
VTDGRRKAASGPSGADPEPRPGLAFRRRGIHADDLRLLHDLLPLLDLLLLLAASWLATQIVAEPLDAAAGGPFWTAGRRTTLVAAVLLPFTLAATSPVTRMRIVDHVCRFAGLAVAVLGLGLLGGFTRGLSAAWIASWLSLTLAGTSASRLLLSTLMARLTATGVNVERVAVVGGGPMADRLIRQLRSTLGCRLRLVGVFDDRTTRRQVGSLAPRGPVSDLVELGRLGQVDLVVLTLPASADRRIADLVGRLKMLAIPVRRCPANLGLPDEVVETLQADHVRDPPPSLPADLVTLLLRPVDGLIKAWHGALRPRLRLVVDAHDVDSFVGVAARFGVERYGYVVTPNADHLLRLHRDAAFRRLYRQARYTLLDSRLIAHLSALARRQPLPTCPGSDLVARLFASVIGPDDRVVLIGGSPAQAARLTVDHGLHQLRHHNPPMGFIDDPAAVAACLAFVEAHSPFRFCLLAVGCPQQEMLAGQLQRRGIARGLALCIGASINFITGSERRAPPAMQRAGLEWLFRLALSPRRLARRYLLNAPLLLAALPRTTIELRPAEALPEPLPIGARGPGAVSPAPATRGSARRSRRSGSRGRP